MSKLGESIRNAWFLLVNLYRVVALITTSPISLSFVSLFLMFSACFLSPPYHVIYLFFDVAGFLMSISCVATSFGCCIFCTFVILRGFACPTGYSAHLSTPS